MKVFLSLTQVDFVLINALSDLGMKIFTYSSYMREKVFEGDVRDKALESQALI
jgi:hypothetical protein